MFALPMLTSATAGGKVTEHEVAAAGESPQQVRRDMAEGTIEVTVKRQAARTRLPTGRRTTSPTARA
jgi:hypothetical protein